MNHNELVGIWKMNNGNKLIFNYSQKNKISASFISGKTGNLLKREYFNDKFTKDMHTWFDSYEGEYRIDLWKKGKGYSLHFGSLFDFDINKNSNQMSCSISRYAEDSFLDKYTKLLDTVGTYTKIKKFQNINAKSNMGSHQKR